MHVAPQVLVGPDPGVGQEARVDKLAPGPYKLVAVRFDLTTGATVADRRPHLVIEHQGVEVFRAAAAAVQAASTARRYVAAHGNPTSVDTAAGVAYLPLPEDLVLTEQSVVRTATDGLQADDNYGPITLFVLAPNPTPEDALTYGGS